MLRPGPEEAKKYFKDHTVIPVYAELFADVSTSVEVLKVFMKENKKCYLLESVEGVKAGAAIHFSDMNLNFP